jgi:hypothetical protein
VLLAFASDRFHRVAKLREDRDGDGTDAAGRSGNNDPASLRTNSVAHDRRDTLGRGEAGGAVDHRVPSSEALWQRHDPIGRHAYELGVTTPTAGAELMAGNKHLVAEPVIGRCAFHNRSGAIDARHMGQCSHNARMALGRKRVLVIERRIRDVEQHVAGRKVT